MLKKVTPTTVATVEIFDPVPCKGVREGWVRELRREKGGKRGEKMQFRFSYRKMKKAQ